MNRLLRSGDHVFVQRAAGYTHHGIYVGEHLVVHFRGITQGFTKAGIEVDSLAAFVAGGHLEVVEYARAFSDSEVVQRALSRIGQTGYHLAFNNCEHFARWAKTGEHHSEQVHVAESLVAGGASVPSVARLGIAAVGASGAVAGISGPGLMSGLSAIGGSAAGGVAVLAAAPAAAATVFVHRALHDDQCLPDAERSARRSGRNAATFGAVLGTGTALGVVASAGVPGLSGVGIASGLVELGGTMVGGLFAAAAIPVALAAFLGFAVYRNNRQR